MFLVHSRRIIATFTIAMLAAGCGGSSDSSSDEANAAQMRAGVTIVTLEAGDLQWGQTVVEIKDTGQVRHVVLTPGDTSQKVEAPLSRAELTLLKQNIEAAATATEEAEDVEDPGFETVVGHVTVRSKSGQLVVLHAVDRSEDDPDGGLALGEIGDFGEAKLHVTSRNTDEAKAILDLVYRLGGHRLTP